MRSQHDRATTPAPTPPDCCSWALASGAPQCHLPPPSSRPRAVAGHGQLDGGTRRGGHHQSLRQRADMQWLVLHRCHRWHHRQLRRVPRPTAPRACSIRTRTTHLRADWRPGLVGCVRVFETPRASAHLTRCVDTTDTSPRLRHTRGCARSLIAPVSTDSTGTYPNVRFVKTLTWMRADYAVVRAALGPRWCRPPVATPRLSAVQRASQDDRVWRRRESESDCDSPA